MYKRILVPVDGSKTSSRALEEAARLAKITGGRLRLLHIVDPLAHTNGFETPLVFFKELQPALMQAAQDLLDQARGDLGEDAPPVETEVHETRGVRVSEEIINRATDWKADLIVLGTHGRRGIERVMMGSDAEQVVRMASVPVLLVRYPG